MQQIQEFLEGVLPPTGMICIVGIKGKSVVQKFAEGIPTAIQLAQELDANKYNAYFACSSFKDASSRKQDNVEWAKSFFIDIDCGEGKPYADKNEGLIALQEWCKALHLPKPTIVDSGRGLHVYWTLEEAITKDEWQPVADLFKALQSDKGFEVDPTVSADAARILRVPLTHNYKDTPPSEVQVLYTAKPISLESMKSSLESVEAPKNKKKEPKLPKSANSAIPAGYIDPVSAALMSNTDSKFRIILKKSLQGTGCAQIKRIAEQQYKLDEPMWRAGLSIAQVCVDRDEAIHIISSSYYNYDAAYTEKKANETRGPYTCETFDGMYPTGCVGCAHKGKITSPIQLGRYVKKETPVPPLVDSEVADPFLFPTTYPYPYFRGQNGGIYKTMDVVKKTKDGPVTEKEDVLIYKYDLFCRGRTTDIDRGDVVEVVLKLPHDDIRTFFMQTSELQSRDAARKTLGHHGIAVQPVFMERIVAYITDWVDFLERSKKTEKAYKQMGWTEENTFVLGEIEITPTEHRYAPPTTGTLTMASALTAKGSLAEWDKVIEVYGKPGLELQAFTIMLGFGSILYKMFGDLEGGAFNLISKDSGTGKTTLLRAVASIYGDPRKTMMMWKDTKISVTHNMGVLQNIPLCMDEITNWSPEHCSDFLYQTSMGRKHHGMTQHTNQIRTNDSTWQLISICTSNDSIYSQIGRKKESFDGERYRALEAHVRRETIMEKSEADKLFVKLFDNYGYAGRHFIDFVVKNYDTVQQKLLAVRAAFDKAVNMKPVERYWSGTIACGLAGGLIAQQDLGFLRSYDMKAIWDYMVGMLNQSRLDTASATADPASVLGGYINRYIANNTIIIDSAHDGRMKVNTAISPAPYMMPRSELMIRVEKDIHKVFISVKSFRKYCNDGQMPYTEIMRRLREQKLVLGNEKKRLGKGTSLNGPPVDCIVLDATHSAFEVDFDELINESAPDQATTTA